MYFLITGTLTTNADALSVPTENQPISVIQGTDTTIDGYIVNSDSNAVNITGALIKFAVKRHSYDTGAALINRLATIVNGPAGWFRVQLAQADTLSLVPASYLYQISFTTSGTGLLDYPFLINDFIITASLSLPSDGYTTYPGA